VLLLAGLSHKTAPLPVRERLAFPTDELLKLLPALHTRFGPAVLLSTCNRTEAYVNLPLGQAAASDLVGFLAGYGSPDSPLESEHFYALQDQDAVRHLYRVAAGLDSMVVGEAQILGQVRQALRLAQKAGAADRLLERLFESAVAAGRRIRSSSVFDSSALSVSAAAVELARAELGDLAQASVLIVSAGEAAKLTAWSMSRSGARRMVIAGRTLSRAKRLASELGATAVGFHELGTALAEADIVVSATGSRTFAISRALVEAALQARGGRRMLIIDLAVPRDVDPEVGGLAGVALYDVDALQPRILARAAEAGADLTRLNAVAEEEAARFMDWWQARWVVPTIAALRAHAESIRRAELDKTLSRLPNLSEEERNRIDALTSSIINKLLHRPIVSLKEPDGQPALSEALRELFALPLAAD
jgi:glutamyl-tRNA reductase